MSSIPLGAMLPAHGNASNPDKDVVNDTGTNHSANDDHYPLYDQENTIELHVPPPYGAQKTVKRELRGVHILMITINATFGSGLYWRGGQILELGGPLAVVLSFTLIGVLAWSVMQCVAELMCIWPVPSALSVYVREFVDVDLGIAVGIAYWFAYSVGFAALIAASAAELDLWLVETGTKRTVIDSLVVYLVIPVCLICINSIKVKWYGSFEVLVGSIKLFFLAVIIVTVGIVIGQDGSRQPGNWTNPPLSHQYDHTVAKSFSAAVIMCLPVAMYAYIGVEIVAASSLEARPPQNNKTGQLISATVRRTAIWVVPFTAFLYVLSSLLTTFAISSTNCALPRQGWITYPDSSNCGYSSSVFVSIAQKSTIQALGATFNAFLVVTALTCANTNLYVASRTLFGLTRELEGGPDQSNWIEWGLAYLNQTSKRFNVPYRAVIFSAIAFGWVPFLQLAPGSSSHDITLFIDTLGDMASSAIIIVWACVCLSFIRFYFSIKRHRGILEDLGHTQLLRGFGHRGDTYPYRSHLQPVTAIFAFLGCVFILFGANGASFTKGFQTIPFLSSYFVILVFCTLWMLVKLCRGNWKNWFVDLDDGEMFRRKIESLDDMRLSAN